MLDRESPTIVLLSNIRWDFLWQAIHEYATMFANAGYPTVYVETTGLTNPRLDVGTFRKVLKRVFGSRSGRAERHQTLPTNLAVYSPLVAPPTHKVFRLLNERVFMSRVVRDLRSLSGRQPVFIVLLPTHTTLAILSHFEPKLVWYHCVLNYEEYLRAPADIGDTEQRMLRLADIVTVDSSFLKEKHHGVRPDIVQIESGVDFDLFSGVRTEPLSGPVRTICYFGSMDERRFDFALIRRLASAGFSVRLLGTLSDSKLAQVQGVDYRGEVPHRDLPSHLRDADALIIPYRITPFSKGTFPAKTYECLATGKPVVATPLPDLLRFSEHIYLAKSPEEFVRILQLLPELETPEKIDARVDLARQNSWEARFKKFEEILWRKI